jgi:membrane protein YdbS with pleckstrin-like domain
MVTNGYQNQKSLAEVLNGFKEELKDFGTTRFQMLRNELSEKTGAWKIAIPMIAIGVFMGIVAFLLLTGFLVSLIALAFNGQPWAYLLSFAIVFVLYALIAGVTAAYGYRTLKSAGVAPERTLRVLKEDGIWLQTEARTQV